MAVGTGYSKVATSGLVFAYDTGDSFNSYKGEPTTNYWNGNQFSIYNDGATNIRNSTDVAPPVPGYEVVKVTANNIGTYGQCILWNSTYPNNNVATITNSIYAYLTVGDYVQVGQHWYPWYYGTQKSIAKNQWVRISETYTINEGNSYGNAALTYSTNGIAYFAMPQYEYKSHVTPFIGANQTRSNTQGLLDISGYSNTVELANMTYDANALPTFDGTDDYTEVSSFNVNQNNEFTLEAIIYPNTVSTNQSIIKKNTSNDNWPIFSMALTGNNLNGYYSSPVYGQCLEGADGTSGIITANKFWYVAYSKGAGGYTTMKLYINGVSVPYNNFLYGSHINSIATSTRPIHIGRNLDGPNFIQPFNGRIPVTKVYNRQLTDSEVRDNYFHYKTRFGLA